MAQRFAVLGGGVAGVTAANVLAGAGKQVDLFEASSELGGLHRSVVIDGMCFDIGAFLFSAQHQLLRSFPFLAEQFIPVQPHYARITPTGRIDTYPLSVAGFLRDEGILGSSLALASLLKGRVVHRRRDSVSAFAKYYMGERVYERSGLKRYVERLYGLPDDEVGLEFAAQRLASLEHYTAAALVRNQLRQSWNRLKGRGRLAESKALVRPREGFPFVYKLVQRHLEGLDVGMKFGTQLQAIRRTATGFEIDVDNQTRSYDRVVSTIPIPKAQELLGLQPWSGFETMTLYSLFYTGRLRHNNAVQYNFTHEGRWKRITAFSKFYGRHKSQDFWVVEVTTRDTSVEVLNELRADFEAHARSIRLCEGTPVALGSALTVDSYPVFRRNYSDCIQRERERLTMMGIDSTGRQGAFEYLSSLQVAERAQQLSESMLRAEKPGVPVAAGRPD